MIEGRPRRGCRRIALAIFVGLIAPLAAACGKKGPPLPPLRLAPAPVSEITARRSADRVELRFVLPTANQNGPGPVDLGRVDIYAVTVAPGAAAPANTDLLTKARLVGSVPVRPAPAEGEEPATANPADTRPGPGERVTFVEQLTPEKLVPAVTAPAAQEEKGAIPAPDAPAGKSEAVAGSVAAPQVQPGETPAVAEKASLPTTRIYVIRGAARGGRPGAPAPRLAVPLGPPPAAPGSLSARFTEREVVIDWVAPVADPGENAPAFNVYRAGADDAPLNSAPLAAPPFEHPGVLFGEEQCFVVRSVVVTGSVTLESPTSAPECVTPRDIFPPAEPSGLQAVASPGAVELSWSANAETDLAGYVVLRGEAPGDTLQPLMATPTRETTWRDSTVQPGVRYVYAVIALDAATPPNASPQSARQEVTAR